MARQTRRFSSNPITPTSAQPRLASLTPAPVMNPAPNPRCATTRALYPSKIPGMTRISGAAISSRSLSLLFCMSYLDLLIENCLTRGCDERILVNLCSLILAGEIPLHDGFLSGEPAPVG